MTIRALLLPVLGAVALAGCGSSSPPAADATPTTLVTLAKAEQGSLPALVDAYGTAAPAQNGVVTISVPQPGQVTAVLVTQGATVAAGQPVATFAVSPSARSSYLQAADALRAADAQRRTTAQLLTQQLATRDQLVQADKAVADARVALAALQAEGAGSGTMTLRAPFAGLVNAWSGRRPEVRGRRDHTPAVAAPAPPHPGFVCHRPREVPQERPDRSLRR
jgi:multidrug efflux pump subunit AcrA (membrane-fusion protein)